MAGSTFRWQGGTDANGASFLTNWLVEQSGSFVAATVLPGAGDSVTIDNGGTVDDSSGNLPLAGVEINFAGSGGTLELGIVTLGSVSFDGTTEPGGITVGAGVAATVEITSAVTSDGPVLATGAGASLDIQIGANVLVPLLANTSTIAASAGGSVLIASTGASELGNDGEILADNGSVDLTSSVVGTGLLMISAGTLGISNFADVQPDQAIAFLATSGVLVVGSLARSSVGDAVFGFQQGDSIDLTALNFASLEPITVTADIATLTDGHTTFDLPLLGASPTVAGFGTANDGSGGVLLTTNVHEPLWQTAVSGDWSSGSLWSTGSAPGTGDVALIESAAGGFTVTATNESAASVVLMARQATLAASGSFAAAHGIFVGTGVLDFAAGARVSAANYDGMSGAASLEMDSGAQMTLSGGVGTVSFGVLGFSYGAGTALLLQGQATLTGATIEAAAGSATIGFTAPGTMDANAGSSVSVLFTEVGHNGNINVSDNDGLGTLVIDDSGWSDTGSNGTFDPESMIVGVGGQLVVQDNGVLSDSDGAVGPDGSAGGSVTLQDGGTWNITGSLSLGAGFGGAGSVVLQQGSILHSGGMLNVGGTIAIFLAGALDVTEGSTVTAGSVYLSQGFLSVDNTSLLNIGTSSPGGAHGVVIDPGATFMFGEATIAGLITDNGVLDPVNNSTISAELEGSGSIELGDIGPTTIDTTQAWTVPIDFLTGGDKELVLASPLADQGLITHFVPSAGVASTVDNTIDLPSVGFDAATPLTYDATSGVLTLGSAEAPLAQLTLDPGISVGLLSTTLDPSSGGTEILAAAPCFAAGARIRTAHGETAVEELRCGDAVRLASGALAPVQWLGHRRIDCRRHPAPREVWPVRISAGAFGDGMPRRDLRLSPDHAVHMDGVLIPIRYLVNGTTIAQEAADEVAYWHVELDRHDVILAEGLPCESYLDTGNRGAFANGGPAVQMHPDFALGVWKAKACAPLVRDGAELEAARSYLLERAGLLGFLTTRDPALRLVAGGRVVQPKITGRMHRFRLPATARGVRLVSRSAIPAEVSADNRDHRRLGVAVSRITLDGEPIALTDPRLSSGWHDLEYDGAERGDGEGAAPAWRWTDGAAGLALAGVRVLDIEVVMTEQYWVEREERRSMTS